MEEKDRDVVVEVDTQTDCPPSPKQAEIDLLACTLSLYTEYAEMLRRNVEAVRHLAAGPKQTEFVKDCITRLTSINQKVGELLMKEE